MEQIKEGYLKDYVSGQILKSTPEEVQAVQPFEKNSLKTMDIPLITFRLVPSGM